MSCEIHKKIEEYEAAARDLRQRLRQVEERKRILSESLRIMDEPIDQLSESEDKTPGNWEKDYDVNNRDLRKSTLYLRVATSMAETTGEPVHVADVAREVKRRGITDAKHASICATVHRMLRKHPLWKYLSSGTFKLLVVSED